MNFNYRHGLCLILYFFTAQSFVRSQTVTVLEEEFIYKTAPFPSAHASTIEEIPGGLIAAWFGGTREKDEDVEIWASRKVDGKWTKPVSVANGIQHKDKRYPCWNPVLFRYPDGPLVLFYKVGKNPREWWGEMKISHDDGLTWSEAKRLPEDILGPVKNKPLLLDDGRLICGSSKEVKGEGWRVYFEITKDKGRSWELIGPINDPSDVDIIQPSILTYKDGRMQILCRSRNRFVVESWSEDAGYTWTKPKLTELPNPGAGTDAVTLENGLQMIIYNHNNVSEEDDDGGGKAERTPLNLAVSRDGENWTMIHTFEDREGEYSYPAIIQDSEGFIHATYTYKRKKIKYVKLKLTGT